MHPRLHYCHCHQLLPPKLGPAKRQRRVVQPSAAALRPSAAGLPEDRFVQRGNRSRLLQKVKSPALSSISLFFFMQREATSLSRSQGFLYEERGDKVHDQRSFLLQPGPGHERGRRGGCPRGLGDGLAHWLAGNVQELGGELAE